MMLVGSILLVFVLFPQTHLLGGATLITGTVFLVLAAGLRFYNFEVNETCKVMDWLLRLLPGFFREPSMPG